MTDPDIPPVDAFENRVYAVRGTQELRLDLFRPKGVTGPLPAVMRLSGGGWRTGGKRGTLGRLKWLIPDGVAGVAVEYRSTAVAPFPAQIEDCIDAARYLAAHADECGVDSRRIALIGDSAGGHIVAMAAAWMNGEYGRRTGAPRAAAVCAITTPADIAAVQGSDDAVSGLLGGPLGENLERARLASPLHNVHGNLPPHLVLHGALDPGVRVEQVRSWRDALVKAGVPAELVEYPGVAHETDPFYEWDESRKRIREFFARVLGLGTQGVAGIRL